jgi:tetratricopeptide (TPR) repeat protein
VEKAIVAYSKVIELAPTNNGGWYYNRGEAYLYLGRRDKALADYSKAIELDPEHSTYYAAVGHILLNGSPRNKENLEKAIVAYSKVIELDPTNNGGWVNRGEAYLHLGRRDEALADFSKTIALAPMNPHPLTLRAGIYQGMRQWDKAVSDLSKALELEPENAAFQIRLGRLLATCPDAKVRDPKRAVELARKAVDRMPLAFQNTLGVAHYRAGDDQAAVVALAKSVEMRQGGDAVDWLFLAMAHQKLGHHDEARKWYDQAVKWLEKNGEWLAKDPARAEELGRFRTEAAEVLEPSKK